MNKYRKGRMPSDKILTVETGDGPVVAKIVDVNAYGMRLYGKMTVRRGEDLTATLDNWDISAVVRWARFPYCGVQFDSPAPETALDEMRGIGTIPNRVLAPHRRIKDAG